MNKFSYPENETDSIRPTRKKPLFPVCERLHEYLVEYGREMNLPAGYRDLLRFTYSVPLKNKYGKDTLWETVSYDMRDWKYLRESLVSIYASIKTEGDYSFINHLDVARIDFCSFGNSQPFRIRIVNKFNDNYDHYYIKPADANRVYGLELEHLLSPNRITYLTNRQTLVEEHIPGIPGDIFIQNYLNRPDTNPIRLAKEFVKFNERCFVRLLGDMRSYNFVFNITPDIEDVQYNIRAIDFDQQSYEGRKNLYLPQFFKENKSLVELVMKHLNTTTIAQYQAEEHNMMAFRLISSRYRVKELLDIMQSDQISKTEKIEQLRDELSEHFHMKIFLKSQNMGEVLKTQLKQSLHTSLKLIPKTKSRFGD